jgi:hypothetical protein
MKSFFSTLLAILPFLSLITLFNTLSVDARATDKHHKEKHGKPKGNTQNKGSNPTPKRYLAPAPHWVAYGFEDYSRVYNFPSFGDKWLLTRWGFSRDASASYRF